MPRPLTRAQALQNTAFLKALRRTGNVRLAAREVDVKYGTIQHRRRQHPAFAQRWDAELAVAKARLGTVPRGPSTTPLRGAVPLPEQAQGGQDAHPHRTAGGETVVVRCRDGTLQVRRAQPGKLTRRCEQAFLAALSATCNVRLSAAAAGAAEAAFYRRKRQNPAFAREWGLALEQGYLAIEAALLASWREDAYADDAWRHNDPPAVPPMTANQALQLMYLHQKEARLLAEPAHMKRRRGEPSEAYSYRLACMYEAGQERDREAFRVAEAERYARGEPTYLPYEPPPAPPDLAQVAGWSKADPAKAAHDDTRALFGGWRMRNLKAKERGG